MRSVKISGLYQRSTLAVNGETTNRHMIQVAGMSGTLEISISFINCTWITYQSNRQLSNLNIYILKFSWPIINARLNVLNVKSF